MGSTPWVVPHAPLALLILRVPFVPRTSPPLASPHSITSCSGPKFRSSIQPRAFTQHARGPSYTLVLDRWRGPSFTMAYHMPPKTINTCEILESILLYIKQHQKKCRLSTYSPIPFIFGITGVQGSGKLTLAAALVGLLSFSYGYRALSISLDDFYQTHEDRQALKAKYSSNSL